MHGGLICIAFSLSFRLSLDNDSYLGKYPGNPDRKGVFAVTGRAHCQRQVAFFLHPAIDFLF